MQAAIIGASGRMGRALIRAMAENKSIKLCGALVSGQSAQIGQDSGEFAQIGANGILYTDSMQRACADAEALIDFSAPAVSCAAAAYAAEHGLIHIIGTTGFTPHQQEEINRAAKKIIIVKSGNMSLGVNLLAALTEKAAAALGADFDIEILEMHHRNKADAPSGTALLLGEAAAKGRAINLPNHSIYERHGQTGKRETGAIGFASLRGGTVAGEHSIIFAGNKERITLSHSAEDRSIFADGALTAALWAKGKPRGLYSMRDVLGLNAPERD